ncbi:MAG: DUF4783 domain-containing protein [Bacteroidia bacterium]
MRLIYLTFALLVIASLSAFNSPTEKTETPVLEEISAYLENKNVDQLAQLFDQQVEISISGQSKAYAKAQARQVIKSFVDQNPPRKFNFDEQGTTLHMLYALGVYSTDQSSFEVGVYLKKKGTDGQYKIDQMRIERK